MGWKTRQGRTAKKGLFRFTVARDLSSVPVIDFHTQGYDK